MKNLKTHTIIFLLLGLLSFTKSFSQTNYLAEPFSSETLDQWMEEVSNWGRWGDNDQLGTLNLITPQVRKEAAALVQSGRSVSLAMDLDTNSGLNNSQPLQHTFTRMGQWTMDTYSISYHGYAHSHLDAQRHIAQNGKIYNGYPEEDLKQPGTGNMGVHHMRNGIFSRGLLVDMPRLKRVPYLEPATSITIEDLEAWEKKTGITVKRGDILLIRTGRWAREKEKGAWNFVEAAAGLHASTAKWLKEREVAVLGSDGTADVLPSGNDSQTHPLHQLVLIGMGMPLLDNLNLEDVADVAAEHNRWEFLLVVAPLRIVGGTGSPLNPIATF
ncbi:MAG: cyclase family protein [Cyclobacteriaceae bacterium]